MQRSPNGTIAIDAVPAPPAMSSHTRRSDLLLVTAAMLTVVSILLWRHALDWTNPILAGTGETCGRTEYGPPIRNSSVQTVTPALLSAVAAFGAAAMTQRPKLAAAACATAIVAAILTGLGQAEPLWWSVVIGDCS